MQAALPGCPCLFPSHPPQNLQNLCHSHQTPPAQPFRVCPLSGKRVSAVSLWWFPCTFLDPGPSFPRAASSRLPCLSRTPSRFLCQRLEARSPHTWPRPGRLLPSSLASLCRPCLPPASLSSHGEILTMMVEDTESHQRLDFRGSVLPPSITSVLSPHGSSQPRVHHPVGICVLCCSDDGCGENLRLELTPASL